jgi:glycosyltransferase involved in cell wall biosynthesis
MRRERNGGIALATNSAASLATGEFLAFLDHDDLLTPDALGEVAIDAADHADTDVRTSNADNGPLVYYPGSHQWPIFTNEHIGVPAAPATSPYEHYDEFVALWKALVGAAKTEPDRFFAKKGQALIWAANLLHGGDVHIDKMRTRWSQVTHYFFEGCSYYTPLMSDPFFGEIYFREPTDIASGEGVRNIVSGRHVPAEFIRATSHSGRGKQGTPHGRVPPGPARPAVLTAHSRS